MKAKVTPTEPITPAETPQLNPSLAAGLSVPGEIMAYIQIDQEDDRLREQWADTNRVVEAASGTIEQALQTISLRDEKALAELSQAQAQIALAPQKLAILEKQLEASTAELTRTRAAAKKATLCLVKEVIEGHVELCAMAIAEHYDTMDEAREAVGDNAKARPWEQIKNQISWGEPTARIVLETTEKALAELAALRSRLEAAQKPAADSTAAATAQ